MRRDHGAETEPAMAAPWGERRALVVLGLLSLGMWLAGRGVLPDAAGWALLAAGGGSALVGIIARGWSRRLSLALAVVLIGAGWFRARCDESPADRLVISARSLVDVEGVMLNTPRPIPIEPSMQGFEQTPGRGWRSALRVSAWFDEQGARHASIGTMRVRFERPAPGLSAGSLVRLSGFASPAPGAMNPGERDRRRIAAQEGEIGHVTVPDEKSVMVAPRAMTPGETARGWAARWSELARSRALAWIHGQAGPGDERAQLLSAMLIGRDAGALRDLSGAFTRVGLAHVLSVSGMNLTLLAWFVLMAVRLTGDRPHAEKLVVGAVVGVYLLVVPAEAPILRAALMIGVFLLAELGGRRYDRVNTLAWAAVITLLWRPMDLWSPGFQLSYLSVAALFELTGPLRRRLFGDRVHPDDTGAGLRGWLLRRLEELKTGTSAAVCAWGVSTPVIIFHTGVFSVLGPAATLVVWPMVSAITGLGYFTLLAATVAPAAAGAAEPVLHALGALLAWTVRTLDQAPGTVWYLPAVSAPWAVSATLSVAWWMRSPRSMVGAARTITPSIALVLAAWLAVETLILPRIAQPAMRLDVLHLSGGACHVVRGGTGEAVIVDCGSPDPGAGEWTIRRALRALGVTGAPTVILSHAEGEAYSALLDVAPSLGVREVLIGEQYERRALDVPHGEQSRLLNDLRRRGVTVRVVSAGDSVRIGAATIDIVSPAPGELMDTHRDASLVVRARVRTDQGERSVLLLGERRDPGMRALRTSVPGLKADVVRLPGAGRAGREPASSAERLGARVAVVTGGTSRAERPATGDGPDVLDTSVAGCVSIRFEPGGDIRWSTFARPLVTARHSDPSKPGRMPTR